MPDKRLGEAAWRGRRPGSGVPAHTAPSRGFSARPPRGAPSQLRRWQPRAGAPRGPARGRGELGGRLPPGTPRPSPPVALRRPGGFPGCVTHAFSLAREGSPGGGPRAAGRAEPCDWRRSRIVSSNALLPALPAARTLSPAPPPTPRPHPSSGARLLLPAGSGPGRRAAEQPPAGAAGAPRSEPWEAPTLRARGAGSRPRRGPRDPERPRESQHPQLPPPRSPGPLFGALSAGPGWERTAPVPPGLGKWGLPRAPAGRRGGPGGTSRPKPHLAGPGGRTTTTPRGQYRPQAGCGPAPALAVPGAGGGGD